MFGERFPIQLYSTLSPDISDHSQCRCCSMAAGTQGSGWFTKVTTHGRCFIEQPQRECDSNLINKQSHFLHSVYVCNFSLHCFPACLLIPFFLLFLRCTAFLAKSPGKGQVHPGKFASQSLCHIQKRTTGQFIVNK